jgi:hypothetical protein
VGQIFDLRAITVANDSDRTAIDDSQFRSRRVVTVLDLTFCAHIKLNARVSLRRHEKQLRYY